MSHLNPFDLWLWVTKAAIEHPKNLSHALVETFDVSRATAASALARLTEEGWLIRHGSTRPSYTPGKKRLVHKRYTLPGLDEFLCWEHDFRKYFDLPKNIESMCVHGFTEMLNNANDHSAGTQVNVHMQQDEHEVSIAIVDNGIGIFERIASALNLPDRRLALLELSKGKLTTDPKNHSGEGIFFTSRLFDNFLISANQLLYSHTSHFEHDWLAENDFDGKGTAVQMAVQLNSQRTTKEVFNAFTDDDFSFDRTVVPVRLARLGNENLVSRSQAKRLIQRFDRFKTVVLDFAEVPEVGQAFADELFRVFAHQHPEIKLIPENMSEDVVRMVKRALANTM